MKTQFKIVLTAVAGAGLLALTASSASAEIACNDAGDCWHVKNHYNYKPEFHVAIHPDNWAWTDAKKYHWREHDGRGYWRGDVWIGF